jgi:hypothetical protein
MLCFAHARVNTGRASATPQEFSLCKRKSIGLLENFGGYKK